MPPDDGEYRDPSELQNEIERLRADLELERRRATENEYRADNLDAQVSQSTLRIHSAQVAQLTAQEGAATDAINAAAQEIANLKSELANLQAEGKFEEAADIQEKIGDAAARRQQAAQAKAYFAQQKQVYSQAPPDPVDRFLSENRANYTDEDAAWIRNNRRYATDQAFRNRVIEAHGQALQRGIRQRSPEYYQFLENAAYMRPAPPPPAEEERQEAAPSGYAPSGYEGGNEEPEPEIRIRQESEMPQNAPGEAYGRRAENPQSRAAGNGSLRGAIAGSPSRRQVTSGSGRRTILEMSEEDRDTALAIAPHLADDKVLAGGQPAILKWYWEELNNSGAANRIRREWADRRF